MSNKPFKAQASSSRATLGGGFGERVPGATYIWDTARPHVPLAGSILSYLVPPPDIQWISDPNVVVSFKSLSKKDATTKTKALEDLRAFVKSPPPFQENIESTIIQAWVSSSILYSSRGRLNYSRRNTIQSWPSTTHDEFAN